MAKSKSKKPSSRAKPKRAAKPAGKAAARAKSVKPAAKPRPPSPRPSLPRPPSAQRPSRNPLKPPPSPNLRSPRARRRPKPRRQRSKLPGLRQRPSRRLLRSEKRASKSHRPPVARAIARPPQIGRDWSATLFLPKTDFPMKAGLPEREPELLKRWAARFASTTGCAKRPWDGRSSSCMTARLTPTATSISAPG